MIGSSISICGGNHAKLCDAALAELGEQLPGRTLQVACVYGDLTCRLSERAAAAGGSIDVVDVLPIQLNNLRRKLPRQAPARLLAIGLDEPKAAQCQLEQISFCLNPGDFPTLCRSGQSLGVESFLGASDAEALFHRLALPSD